MAEPVLKDAQSKAVDDICALFREDQPLGLIALELLVSSRVLDAVSPGTKLWKALDAAYSEFSADGFWKSSPAQLTRIIELTANEMHKSKTENECRQIAESILNGDPGFLSSVTFPVQAKN